MFVRLNRLLKAKAAVYGDVPPVPVTGQMYGLWDVLVYLWFDEDSSGQSWAKIELSVLSRKGLMLHLRVFALNALIFIRLPVFIIKITR